MRAVRSVLRLSRAALAMAPLAGLPALLAGCGFHPLYGEGANHVAVADDLKDIYVANIPERAGQQLRQALQTQMAGDGPEDPHQYTLRVQPNFGAESIDIHADNTSGRTRVVGRAHWQLFTVAEHPELLAQGDAQTLDGYTVTYEQFFAQTLNDETTLGRVAQALGAEITQQVATWFRTRVQPASVAAPKPRAFYPLPNVMPESSNMTPMEQEGEDAVPDMATGRGPSGAGRF